MKNTAPSPIPARFLANLHDEASRLLDDLAAMPRPKTDLEVARKARAIICVHKLLETLYRGVPETEPQAARPQPLPQHVPQPVNKAAPIIPPAVSLPVTLPGLTAPQPGLLSRVNTKLALKQKRGPRPG